MSRLEPSLTVNQLSELLVKPIIWNILEVLNSSIYVVRYSFLNEAPDLFSMGIVLREDGKQSLSSYNRDELVSIVNDIDSSANIIFD